jgi:hypothetical protein
MRAATFVVLLAVLLGVSGCVVYSLHPGYVGPHDFAVEVRLAGTWAETPATSGGLAGPENVRIVAQDERALRVTHWFGDAEGSDSLVSLGHVLRFGQATIVDLEPDPALEVSAFVLPAHTFWKVEFAGDTLRWGGLDIEWAARVARERAVRCAVDSVGDGGDPMVVLTGRTPAVRRLLARAAADPRAFALKSMVRVAVPVAH